MLIRRWVLTPVLLTCLASTAASLSPVLAQQKKDSKLDKAQQQELQAAYKMADAMAAGQPVPGDIGLSIHTDFLKAQNGLTFVPFVLSLDPAQLPSRSVTLYLRVVARTPAAAPAAAATDAKNLKKDANPTKDPAAAPAPEYAFQGVHFVDLKAPAPGRPYRLARAFSVPAGDYDLYLVVKERTPAGAKGKTPAQKVGFLKQPITVPDLWGNDLATSSIIIADEVKPLDTPPTAEQIVEQPYTFGNTIAAPATSTKFSKTGSLSVVFQIYNTGSDGNRKPDVAVEYLFYQRFSDKPEKFFNKTSPQAFNATTLPPQFDTAVGHPIPGGFSVALASFPEGEYRLEIKITDKLSGKVIVRNIMFSVAV
ncbi:MAG: hypothetical protein NTV05_13155 [Acidobacteria bacterium]|nr:hypothetical protein [Acidobacteriota bacterium]